MANGAPRLDPLIPFHEFAGSLAQSKLGPQEREQEIAAYVGEWDKRREMAAQERARVGQGVEIDEVLGHTEKEAEMLRHPDLPEKVVLWNQIRDQAVKVAPTLGEGGEREPMALTPHGARLPENIGKTYDEPGQGLELGEHAKQSFGYGTLGLAARKAGMDIGRPWERPPAGEYAGASPMEQYEPGTRIPGTDYEITSDPGAAVGRAMQMGAGAMGGLASEAHLLPAMKGGVPGMAAGFGLTSTSRALQEEAAKDYEREQQGLQPEGWGAKRYGSVAARGMAGAVTGALFPAAGAMGKAVLPRAAWAPTLMAETGLLTADAAVERAIAGDPALDIEGTRQEALHSLMFLGGLRAAGAAPGMARGALQRAGAIRPARSKVNPTPGFGDTDAPGPITSSQAAPGEGAAQPSGKAAQRYLFEQPPFLGPKEPPAPVRPGAPGEEAALRARRATAKGQAEAERARVTGERIGEYERGPRQAGEAELAEWDAGYREYLKAQGLPEPGAGATAVPGEQLPVQLKEGFVSSKQPGASGYDLGRAEPGRDVPTPPGARAASAASRGELIPEAAEAMAGVQRATVQRAMPGMPSEVPPPPGRAPEAIGAMERAIPPHLRPAPAPPPTPPVMGMQRPPGPATAAEAMQPRVTQPPLEAGRASDAAAAIERVLRQRTGGMPEPTPPPGRAQEAIEAVAPIQRAQRRALPHPEAPAAGAGRPPGPTTAAEAVERASRIGQPPQIPMGRPGEGAPPGAMDMMREARWPGEMAGEFPPLREQPPKPPTEPPAGPPPRGPGAPETRKPGETPGQEPHIFDGLISSKQEVPAPAPTERPPERPPQPPAEKAQRRAAKKEGAAKPEEIPQTRAEELQRHINMIEERAARLSPEERESDTRFSARLRDELRKIQEHERRTGRVMPSVSALRARGARKAREEPPPKVEPAAPKATPVEKPAEGARRPPAARGEMGSKTEIGYPDTAEKVPGRWETLDANEAITSHGADFATEPRFPRDVQGRQRARPEMQESVMRIERDPDPTKLGEHPTGEGGAPVLGPDNVVESGNGRMIALKRLIGAEGMAKYQQWLLKNAKRFGLDPQAIQARIDAGETPILIRRRTQAMSQKQRAEFAGRMNIPSVTPLSPAEAAVADAGRMKPELVGRLTPTEGDPILAAKNQDFVRAFMNEVVPPAERNQLLDARGQLSLDGARRIRNALFAYAYGRGAKAGERIALLEKMAESAESDIRALTNALVQAAPRYAKLRAEVKEGRRFSELDLSDDIAAAAEVYGSIKAGSFTLAEWLKQRGLFGEAPETQRLLVQLFHKHAQRPNVIRKTLQEYAKLAEGTQDPAQQGIFGPPEAPNKFALLDAARIEAEAPIRRQGEVGALFPQRGMGAFEKRRVKTTVSDPEVADVLTRTREAPDKQAMVKEIYHWIAGKFNYLHDIRHDPWVQEMHRQSQGQGHKIVSMGADDMADILGPLIEKNRAHERTQWADIIKLRDIVEGENLPGGQAGGLKAQQYRQALAEVEAAATPDVRRAVEHTHRVFRREAEIDVGRGVLPPEVLQKKYYYPHRILDFSAYLESQMAGMTTRLKEMTKGFAHRRGGTERPHDMDAIQVVWQHLNTVRMARHLDTLATRILEARDVTGRLNPAEKAAVAKMKLTHGKVMELRGHRYKAYQYRPWGNQYYLVTNFIEQVGLDATTPIRVGNQRFFLIPETLGNHLDTWRAGSRAMNDKFAKKFLEYHSFWKRITLDAIGMPFEIRNFFGDSMHYLAEEGAWKYAQTLPFFKQGRDIFQYSMALRHPSWLKKPEGTWQAKMFEGMDMQFFKEMLLDRDVGGGAGYFGAEIGQLQHGKLREIAGQISPLKRKGLMVLDAVEYLRKHREDWLRISKALEDWHRIQRGEAVKTKVINVDGLSPMDAAAKVARGFPTDYGAVAPFVGSSRKWLFPFMTWYVHQAKYWPTYAWKQPMEAAAKFGTLLGGLFYWNTVIHGEHEKRTPLWQRMNPLHLQTGWLGDDGEPIVIGAATGFEVVAQLLNIDKMMAATQEYMWGELSDEEYMQELIPEPLLGLPEITQRLLGPLPQMAIGLWTNKDPFSNRPVVTPPDILQDGGLAVRKQQAWYAFEKIASPVMIYEQTLRRAERDPDFRSWDNVGRFLGTALEGPLNWERGLGRYNNVGVMELQRRNLQHIRRNSAEVRQAREALKKAYKEARISGEWEKFRQLYRDARAGKFGTRISVKDWERWQKAPRLQKEIAQGMANAATNREDRVRWLGRVKYWEQKMITERIKHESVSAREQSRLEQARRGIDRPPIPGASRR